MTSEQLVEMISAAAADKKARDIVTIDLRGKTTIADFFVVWRGTPTARLEPLLTISRRPAGQGVCVPCTWPVCAMPPGRAWTSTR